MDINLTVRIEASADFCKALDNFANTLVAAAACAATAPVMAEVPKAEPAPITGPAPVAEALKTEPAPITQPAPAPVVEPPAAAPAAPAYTQDQLALAASGLIDQGRMGELQALLASFGVPSLVVLPQSRYGEFADKLREMGGKI